MQRGGLRASRGGGLAGVRSPWLRTGAVHLWNSDTPGRQLQRCEVSPSCLCTQCKTALALSHTHTVQITSTCTHLCARERVSAIACSSKGEEHDIPSAGEQMFVASLHMILTSAIQPESFWKGLCSFPPFPCCYEGATHGSELGLPHHSKKVVDSSPSAFLCGLCMFSPCQRGFPPVS